MEVFPFPFSNILRFVFIVVFVLSCSFCGEVDKECESGKLDLVIILDTSKSVGEKNFPKCINFIENLLTALPVEPDSVRVALVRYSSDAQVVSYLNQAMAKGEKLKEVSKIKYIKGSTFTNLALRIADLEVLMPVKGDRLDVSDLVILITDGESSDPTLTMEETEALKQRANLKIFTIGVGKEIHEEELQTIASDLSYSVSVDSFSGLADLIQNMTSVTCTESTKAGLVVSYDELPRDIFYSDVMMSAKNITSHSSDKVSRATSYVAQESSHVTQANDHVKETTGHVTQETSHFTQETSHVTQETSHVTQATNHVAKANDHVKQTTGHVTQEPSHVTKRIGHVTQAFSHVTRANDHVEQTTGHVTQATGHITQATGHVTQATGHVTQATGHVTRATGHVTRATGHVTRATGHVTQATGHITQATSHVTQATDYVTRGYGHATQADGKDGPLTQPIGKNETLNDAAIETDGNTTSSQVSAKAPKITVPYSTTPRAYNLTLSGVRAATFLTYLGVAIGGFVAMLGAVTFTAVMARNKCSNALSTEL